MVVVAVVVVAGSIIHVGAVCVSVSLKHGSALGLFDSVGRIK